MGNVPIAHRYIIHLWDLHHDGTWENRSTYTYYTELILELAALSIDFLHHVHMLVRGRKGEVGGWRDSEREEG